jgi:hypothetical protein
VRPDACRPSTSATLLSYESCPFPLLLPARRSFEFINPGNVLAAKFSLDQRFLAIARSANEVEFIFMK